MLFPDHPYAIRQRHPQSSCSDKFEADRIQLFHLLFKLVERLLRKYGIHSRINLEPPGPSFAGLPGFLYAAPAVVCTENLIRVDDVMESPKLAE